MKKLTGLMTLIAIAVLFSFCSCTKSDIQEEVETSVTKTETTPEKPISYTISKKQLVEELEALMSGREKGDFEFNKAQIKYLSAFDQYEITVLIGDFIPTEVVCSGGGYSFASRVADWFALNPDGCLEITFDGDETYSADDDC